MGMHYFIISLVLAGSALAAGQCGIEPVELAPVTSGAKMVHVCVCDQAGNCAWGWAAEKSRSSDGILDAVANHSKTAQENERREEQIKALRLENEARRRQQLAAERGPRPPTSPTKAELRLHASIEAARAKHPDFNRVISDGYNPTPEIREIVSKSPVAGELAYRLAKNPEEYQRIAGLSKGMAARELRKIGDGLKN